MKTLNVTRKKNSARKKSALAVLGAAALLFTPILLAPASAQGPQGGFGGPGGGGPGFGGPGGGGQGGFNRRPPFASGTVTAVDAGAGTITISSRFGGGDQTIQTQGTTQIVSRTAASVSDLKKGDKIEVRGVPTGITASTLTIGESPLSNLGGPGGPPPGGFGNAPGGNGPGASSAPATASATGTVTSTSPLTISLSDSASLTLKLSPSAKVTKYATVTLSSIKVGDRVLGIGTANDDGTFAATTVALNMDAGGFGQGGRGGFGRGGSFGGPPGGGFGGPGGGFGGPGGPPPPGGPVQ